MSLLNRNLTGDNLASSTSPVEVFSFPVASGVMSNNGTIRISGSLLSVNETMSSTTVGYNLFVGSYDTGTLHIEIPTNNLEIHKLEFFVCASGTDKLFYHTSVIASDNGEAPNPVRAAFSNGAGGPPTVSWLQDQTVRLTATYAASNASRYLRKHIVLAEIL